MFVGVTIWRFTEANAAAGVTFLYTAPIALLAVSFGFRGGVYGAGVALGMTTVWMHFEGSVIGDSGYVVRIAAFVAAGLVVGWQADRRQSLEREADRWFSISDELACVANFDGYFTRVNPSWTRLLGYDEQELLQTPFVSFVHPDDVQRTGARSALLASRTEGTARFENRYRAKDGTFHWLQWSTSSDGKAIYASARDITAQKQLEQQLVSLATQDPLTGVANRRGWDARLVLELIRANRSEEPLCVVMIDFDGLKQLNDSRGHAAGDRVLAVAAESWSRAVREGDLLARLGGDEFALLLPACGLEDACDIVTRMRASTPGRHGFSAGIAEWDRVEPDFALVRRADKALYAAKAQGRGRTVLGDRSLRASTHAA
jgi:diguanylate cyclase (GGDEF)-like protein/PAS domain S-box-containing protein